VQAISALTAVKALRLHAAGDLELAMKLKPIRDYALYVKVEDGQSYRVLTRCYGRSVPEVRSYLDRHIKHLEKGSYKIVPW
jgi:hypothetical protein